MTPHMLQARGLVKRYRDGTLANRGIDLDVRCGEVVAILGPNGAGKTTFLRQITTELRPTSGTIMVGTVDAVREPERAKRLMGITPQEAGVFESLTVRAHLELFARLKGLSGRASADDTLRLAEELNLVPQLQTRVGRLSAGQRRRVLIGLALLGNPPLLVLDEPTTGLDPASRRTVWQVLERIVDSGTSIILSTHYIEEAERLSDRVAIIAEGALLACGTIPELLSRIHDSYRLSYHDPDDAAAPMQVRRCATFKDVHTQIDRLALAEYSVARASLEDVYFALAGTPASQLAERALQ
jgi:ABC-2 type transport system ATP-binding protein